MPPLRTPLSEIARLFLKLGTTAFGGPAAHIALMEEEVVRRRGWLTRERFLDLLGATHLIPGPNSTELAIHIGHARAGWRGLLVAGVCFIVPATLMVGVLAWVYVRFGALPAAAGLWYTVPPVVIAVVLQALVSLGRGAARNRRLVSIGAAALLARAVGGHELAVLFGAGGVGALAAAWGARRGPGSAGAARALLVLGLAAPGAAGAAAAATAAPVALGTLFGVFLKIGAVLFGSGYVLLAFLQSDLVERHGWLSERQLLDAVAVGQVTPGPVFTTATFVGYLLGGWAGAAVATLGIFLPAFVYVAASGPLVPRLRRSAVAGGALDGVNGASLALMTWVTVQLGRATLGDVPSVLLLIASGVLLMRYRIRSTGLLAGAAVLGLALGALAPHLVPSPPGR